MSDAAFRPNLFIIGAAKSGTSWLHQRLAGHPAIFMSEPKEPFYFVEPEILRAEWPFMYQKGFWRGEDRYLDLFAAANGASVIGESSTGYTMAPDYGSVAERLHAFNPDAKLIYLLRHPTERTLSHYYHFVKRRGLNLPPERAIDEVPLFLSVSHYAAQLRPYLELFGRDQIYVVPLEAFEGAPSEEFRRLLAWLKVDPDWAPADLEAREHVTPEVVGRPKSKLIRALNQSASARVLRRLVPRSLVQGLRRFTHQQVDRQAVDDGAARERMAPLHAAQIAELEDLLGQTIREWRS